MTRRNSRCPDGMEHQMPNGRWMCGETHGNQGIGSRGQQSQINMSDMNSGMSDSGMSGNSPTYQTGGRGFNTGQRNFTRTTDTPNTYSLSNANTDLSISVQNLWSQNQNLLKTVENDLKRTIKNNNISLTLDASCSGNNCNQIISRSSAFQQKWSSTLKNLFLDNMGIDTDHLPVRLVRQWYDGLPVGVQSRVNSYLSTEFNIRDTVDSWLNRYPQGIGSGEDEVMFDWIEHEGCVIIVIIIQCAVYYNI